MVHMLHMIRAVTVNNHNLARVDMDSNSHKVKCSRCDTFLPAVSTYLVWKTVYSVIIL